MKHFTTVVISLLLAATYGKVLKNPPSASRFFNVKSSTNIVGGRPARQGETPYQLTLNLFGSHFCGASLVEVDGLQVGVSAGHCVFEGAEPLYQVYSGDLKLSDNSGLEQLRLMDRIVIHQNYSDNTLQNDIALIFFDAPFNLTNDVQTIPLPTQGQVTSDGNLIVSGWGDLEYQGQSPDDLQIVEIPLVNDTYCQEAYQDYIINVIDSMICAGRRTGDISPCHGDSGGPAISDSGYLAGIVSWGHECGHPDYPGVFTKVSSFINWIEATVQNYKHSSGKI